MRQRVDVVVLTWNDGDLLEKAVGSALSSADIDVEVIIVDNGSDQSPTVPDDPRVHLHRNQINRGVAPARNQGVELSDAPVACLLDSDARLEPDALARMVEVLDGDPRIAVVGPVFSGQLAEASAGIAPALGVKLARVLNLRSSYRPVERSGTSWDVDFCIGACQVIRRTAWDQVEGLDESYFYGPEDVDFCLRLREAGWRIVQTSEAVVHHPPRRRFRGLLTRKGLNHGWAVARHLWRHRRFSARVRR